MVVCYAVLENYYEWRRSQHTMDVVGGQSGVESEEGSLSFNFNFSLFY